jgi:hypothetical protein
MFIWSHAHNCSGDDDDSNKATNFYQRSIPLGPGTPHNVSAITSPAILSSLDVSSAFPPTAFTSLHFRVISFLADTVDSDMEGGMIAIISEKSVTRQTLQGTSYFQ